MENIRAHQSSGSKILNAIDAICSGKNNGWCVKVEGEMFERSELGKKVTFSYYERGEHLADARVVISSEWSMHPHYGEPDTFLGYSVTDDDYNRADGVLGRHLSFDEAIDTAKDHIASKWDKGPERAQEYQSWHAKAGYDNLGHEEEYADLCSIVENAAAAFAEYHNTVTPDGWEELSREDIDIAECEKLVIAQALETGMIDFEDLHKLRVVVDNW